MGRNTIVGWTTMAGPMVRGAIGTISRGVAGMCRTGGGGVGGGGGGGDAAASVAVNPMTTIARINCDRRFMGILLVLCSKPAMMDVGGRGHSATPQPVNAIPTNVRT